MIAETVHSAIDASRRWSDCEHHESCGSTNVLAKDALLAGAPAGLVVLADMQTAGRGRLDRRWEDAGPGTALLMSVTVDEAACACGVGLVPLAAGLAVREAIVASMADIASADVRIKWPNDVLVQGKKVAGILVERLDEGLVLGLGINIDFVQRATVSGHSWASLASFGHAPARWELAASTLRALDETLDSTATATVAAVNAHLAQRGEKVLVSTSDSHEISGVCLSVGPDGALVLLTPDGELAVSSGDVEPAPSPGRASG